MLISLFPLLICMEYICRTRLDFLFLTENEMKFVQMSYFLKGIASLRIIKVTKYGRISAIF